MKHRLAALVLAGLVLAAAPALGQTPAGVVRAAADRFGHVPEKKLAPDVSALAISFTSPSGKAVDGELVMGRGKGPHPAVLFVHWLGDPKTTNRTEFEPDAVALARKGVTSLLVDTVWARPGWFDTVGKSSDEDVAQAREQLAELRRGLDILALQPSVDPARIAYVGHDFGAMFGALLAGVDSRPRVFVLMAGVPTMSQWYLLGKTHPQREAYVAALDALDIKKSLGASHAKGFLFQFASKDHYVKPQDAAAFFEAAPLPRGLFTYDADHDLDTPQAHADRLAWLVEQLLGP